MGRAALPAHEGALRIVPPGEGVLVAVAGVLGELSGLVPHALRRGVIRRVAARRPTAPIGPAVEVAPRFGVRSVLREIARVRRRDRAERGRGGNGRQPVVRAVRVDELDQLEPDGRTPCGRRSARVVRARVVRARSRVVRARSRVVRARSRVVRARVRAPRVGAVVAAGDGQRGHDESESPPHRRRL